MEQVPNRNTQCFFIILHFVVGHSRIIDINPLYEYGHGYDVHDGVNGYVTIMGPRDDEYPDRVNFYSNPR